MREELEDRLDYMAVNDDMIKEIVFTVVNRKLAFIE